MISEDIGIMCDEWGNSRMEFGFEYFVLKLNGVFGGLMQFNMQKHSTMQRGCGLCVGHLKIRRNSISILFICPTLYLDNVKT